VSAGPTAAASEPSDAFVVAVCGRAIERVGRKERFFKEPAGVFRTRPARGRDFLIWADLQPLAAILDWGKQRRRWQRLLAK
jgi:hypothetical protein